MNEENKELSKEVSTVDSLYESGTKEKIKKDSAEEQAVLLTKARERARDGATFWDHIWKAAEDDLTFINGDQWPESVRTEREADGRPCLTNNTLPVFIDQVLGEQLQYLPSIKITAVDAVTVPDDSTGKNEKLEIQSETGESAYDLAKVMSSLIKGIEDTCNAETAYDLSLQAAVESSLSYLRVRSDYLSDQGFDQDLVIENIRNQFSVIMDPSAKKPDYSDMNWCFIDDYMAKDAFEEMYPDATADPATSSQIDMSEWFAEKTVRVSEYFTREAEDKEIALLSDGRSVLIEEIKPIIDELQAKDITIKRTRKVKHYKVFWRKITGTDVLEGPIEIPCSRITVAPVFGKSLTIKNKTFYRSLIRHAKDAMRMANYWDSAATENIALAPKAPFIGAEGHTEGKETEWENANTSNLSILTYVPQYQGDPGPRREMPPAVPAAELTMASTSTDKVKSTIGMFDASLGNEGNETSGKAIIARQRQGDRGTFAFPDNRDKAIVSIGEMLIEMIPVFYDSERLVTLKFEDDSEDVVRLNKKILDEQTQEWVTINDLSVQKYKVTVTRGASYATQRLEAAESMLQFIQAFPQAGGFIGDLVAKNMDWPGADAVAERLKKMIPPNVLSKSEQEDIQKDQPEPVGPTPEQQVEMRQADASMAEADADIAQAEAKKVVAEIQSDDAKEKLKQIEQFEQMQGQLVGVDQSMQQMTPQDVRQIVAEALAEVMAAQQQSSPESVVSESAQL